MQHTNHVEMVVEVCGIIEIGFTLQNHTSFLSFLHLRILTFNILK